MIISGLNTLVQPLMLAPELQAAANVVENSGRLWTSKDLIAILQRKGEEWLMLPAYTEVAALAGGGVLRHMATCHNWMTHGRCTK